MGAWCVAGEGSSPSKHSNPLALQRRGSAQMSDDDNLGDLVDALRVAQMEIVFQPLIRLTIGVVMLVLGGCMLVYGVVYSPNTSCNEMPDYDLAIGGLLVACGLSHLAGMCLSHGHKLRMQLHMAFDV